MLTLFAGVGRFRHWYPLYPHLLVALPDCR
jgi:hypothetical protein